MHQKWPPALLFIAPCTGSAGASTHIGAFDHEHPGFFTGLIHPLAVMVPVGLWGTAVAGFGVALSA